MSSGISRIIILLLFSFLIISCKRNGYRINVSSVRAEIEISRLEMDLFTVDPAEIIPLVPSLKGKYGQFLQLFSNVINTGDTDDPSFGDLLTGFCTDKLNNEVYNEVIRQYPDIESIEKEFEDAFRHYLWYFPEKYIPSLFTCTTGFNYSIITGDSVIGVSLDRYLGSESEYYPRLQIYSYISARMSRQYIVPDCIYGWGASEWDFESMGYPADNVLCEIIHEGKLRYFERCMMPEIPDTIIFGFTVGQMNFCRNNERQMWQYLIEHDLIFSTDQFTIRKLTGEAPFTSYFTNESPGRAANWLGYRIVESYMLQNKDVELGGLMGMTDVQEILGGARYDPR